MNFIDVLLSDNKSKIRLAVVQPLETGIEDPNEKAWREVYIVNTATKSIPIKAADICYFYQGFIETITFYFMIKVKKKTILPVSNTNQTTGFVKTIYLITIISEHI